MTTLVKITIAFLLALFLSSCGFNVNFGDFGNGIKGNGMVIDETREITGEFTVVSTSEGLDVYVTQAADFEITIEADENIIDLIGTDIKNGKLRIHTIENIGRATKKIYVSLPNITGLNSSSGADLIVQNNINTDNIDLDASSGSFLEAAITANKISVDASSGANIKLSGKTDFLYTDASSGANIKGKELMTKKCDADASSGANISVNVSESLTADASSGGNISYSGEASVRKNKSVSGSVRKY